MDKATEEPIEGAPAAPTARTHTRAQFSNTYTDVQWTQFDPVHVSLRFDSILCTVTRAADSPLQPTADEQGAGGTRLRALEPIRVAWEPPSCRPLALCHTRSLTRALSLHATLFTDSMAMDST